MTTRPLARADLVTGVVLLILGIAVVVESYGMPRLEERSINPWTAPGLVPGLLGIILAVLGGAMALRSLAAGALRARTARSETEAREARAALGRLLLCLALCLGYAVLLVGRVPFWLATGLFVLAFVVAFEWRREDAARARLAKFAAAGILAGAAMLAIPYVFERLFLVRLP
jgi:putative tricarboxylic transport membrane protein